MKLPINKRSLTFFLLASATLIAVTSFLTGYTDGEIRLLSPFVIILASGIIAFLFETAMQRPAK